MAADSLQTGHYIDRIEVVKVQEVRESFIGCAGNSSSINRFLEWFNIAPNQGAAFPSNLDEDFCALQVRDGTCYYWDCSGIPSECGLPAAIGTGAQFAMGALMAGCTPYQAVGVAIELDTHSGGNIYFVGKMRPTEGDL